jgi:hypothetical protein
MRREKKQHGEKQAVGNLLLVLAAAIFVVLLLIRLLAFVTGRGIHRY